MSQQPMKLTRLKDVNAYFAHDVGALLTRLAADVEAYVETVRADEVHKHDQHIASLEQTNAALRAKVEQQQVTYALDATNKNKRIVELTAEVERLQELKKGLREQYKIDSLRLAGVWKVLHKWKDHASLPFDEVEAAMRTFKRNPRPTATGAGG